MDKLRDKQARFPPRSQRPSDNTRSVHILDEIRGDILGVEGDYPSDCLSLLDELLDLGSDFDENELWQGDDSEDILPPAQ